MSVRPDDETSCAGCGVPMFVPSDRAAGETFCESCEADRDVASVATVGLGGLRVRVQVTQTADGPLLSLYGENCGLEGELPGEYYLTPLKG